jgi:hypothetical protein
MEWAPWSAEYQVAATNGSSKTESSRHSGVRFVAKDTSEIPESETCQGPHHSQSPQEPCHHYLKHFEDMTNSGSQAEVRKAWSSANMGQVLAFKGSLISGLILNDRSMSSSPQAGPWWEETRSSLILEIKASLFIFQNKASSKLMGGKQWY